MIDKIGLKRYVDLVLSFVVMSWYDIQNKS